MTYEEAVQALTDVRAAIARVTGTATSGGAQEYTIGGNRVVRASLESLQKREAYLSGLVKRLNPNDGGGAVRQPLFETRS